jgi:hypothetical protein
MGLCFCRASPARFGIAPPAAILLSFLTMSGIAVADGRTARRARLGTEVHPGAVRLDARRALQLGLAACWLLDAVLQYQSFMFSTSFARMIGGTAAGNPSVIARPIAWNATLVEHHLVLLNTIFATIQLVLGLGIAFRPTVRAALAASIAWSLAVWWFGERYATSPSRVSLAAVTPVPVQATAVAESVPATVGTETFPVTVSAAAAAFLGPQDGPDPAPTSASHGSPPTGQTAFNTAGPDPASPSQSGPRPGSGRAATGFLLSPATTVSCRIAMGVTMALMLVIMI